MSYPLALLLIFAESNPVAGINRGSSCARQIPLNDYHAFILEDIFSNF
jgi:hypothetical protein